MHTGRLYIQLLIVLLGIAFHGYTQVDFRCATPLNLSGCNHIPNPAFNIQNAGLLVDAFMRGNVPQWGTTGCGTSDINGSAASGAYQAPPLPPAINSVNYASMIALNSYPPPSAPNPYFEGIAVKIKAVQSGEHYGFSFFMSNRRYPLYNNLGATYKLKAVLVRCFNISPAPDRCGDPTPPWVPAITDKQEIFCETFVSSDDTDWKQFFVSFRANSDYDMLLIYPEPTTVNPAGAASYVHIAYPELVDITATASAPDASCNVTLSACGVTNAQYTWTDPNGNVVSHSAQATVNAAIRSGNYTVTIQVPAEPANNTCSENYPVVTRTVHVAPCSTCIAMVTQASLTYWYNDGISYTGGPYTISLLPNCGNNTICHLIDEGDLTFNLQSNQPAGNTWQLFRDGIPASDPQALINFQGTYPTNQQQYNPTFVFTGFNTPTTFEMRLTNSIVNRTESIFIRLLPRAMLDFQSCWSAAQPTWIKLKAVTSVYTTPATQFIWNFSNAPATFQVSQASPNVPDIEYFLPPGSASFHALVRIMNSQYGCDAVEGVTLHADAPTCSWLAAGTMASPSQQVLLYPNPVSSSFSIYSTKRISSIAVYSAEGKLVKRFQQHHNSKQLHIDDLSKGVYWVVIGFFDHTTETKRIVKTKQ